MFNTRRQWASQAQVLFAGMLLVCSQSGCITLASMITGQKPAPTLDTSMLEAQGYSLPPGGMPMAVEPDKQGRPRVVLEIRGSSEQRHVESIPLPNEPAMFVQDLIQQAQLNEHFGALSISIMRPTTGGAPPIRLQVRSDRDGKVLNPGTNYALLPGDHLVVLENNESLIERFVKSQFGG